MKKILSVLLIALMVLSVTGVLLFRHFVADQIMDKGGMMNPDYNDGTEPVPVLDVDHTYVDNEKLLQMITGTWSSEDGHYTIKLDDDYRIVLSLDGELLLDDYRRHHCRYRLGNCDSRRQCTGSALRKRRGNRSPKPNVNG